MKRNEMINTVGAEYLTANVENDEFSYPKAYKSEHRESDFEPVHDGHGRCFELVDMRFVKGGVTVLIETKKRFKNSDENQISAYVGYEKKLTKNKTVAILANTDDDGIRVWRGAVSERDLMPDEHALRSIDEYVDFYTQKVNDKERVMQSTYELNELLHRYSIPEKLRSQFVGICLLALKNDLDYKTPTLTSNQIRAGVEEILGNLLAGNIYKADKLASLNRHVMENQSVRELKTADFRDILGFIECNILPFINDKSTAGQDLLNLFFTTFNKYVGKSDKNQAFTPDHITDFMAKIAGVNKHSIVLDPCCGSGSFLVRAMTQALDDCSTAEEQERVKREQVYGIEYDEDVFGLAATNMLIHSDGNSNIMQGSCFERIYDLFDYDSRTGRFKKQLPDIVLMNPPYNGQRSHFDKNYIATWPPKKNEDPSKGLYFVKFIADLFNSQNHKATLAVLLPYACAIASSGTIAKMKCEILENNTLDAVFSLPGDIFHPGASASACCMVFKIGTPHHMSGDTFFGYCKDDGFRKKKNLGRVEQIDPVTGCGRWAPIESEWLDLYRNRRAVAGKSAVHKVTGEDEWLCEAYMQTDYSKLTERDFQQTVNDYLAYLVKEGKVNGV